MVLALIIVFALVIGLIARALMTGNQQLGLPMTIGLGVPASFTGGRSAALVTSHEVPEFHIVGIVGHVLGVPVTLIVGGGFRRPRAHAPTRATTGGTRQRTPAPPPKWTSAN